MPPLEILLAKPRGFCAGVERAVAIVRDALREYGPPVYVRHEIVHNRHVVDQLRDMGAVFVEELDEVPADGLVVFSAHGVPKSVAEEARRRRLVFADATCPLVSKVHREVEHHHRAGRTVLLIGHARHPEVVGTMGQAPVGTVLLIETAEQAEHVTVPDPTRLAYSTQTTLSVSDAQAIVTVLRRRFPEMEGPRSEDICYATTNRQHALTRIASRCDMILVLGSPNSSNSRRLVEVSLQSGCPRAELIESADDIDWSSLGRVRRLGITAGASAPEPLVQGLVEAFRRRFAVTVNEVESIREDVTFRVPPIRRRDLSIAS
jgi:4-hydroxy-3-methylbut-2-enyl diphosphate reductase